MDKVVGKIYDSGDQSPVSDAEVIAIAPGGTAMTKAKTAGDGSFVLTTPESLGDGAMILIQKGGYQRVLVDPLLFLTCQEIGLNQSGNIPSLRVVPAGFTDNTKTLLFIAGLIVLGYFVTEDSGKANGISGIGSIDYTPIIILGALAIGGYLAYQYFFGGSDSDTSGTQDTQNKTATTNNAADVTAAAASAAAGYTTSQQISNGQASSLAIDIWNNMQGSSTPLSEEAQDKIVSDIQQLTNNADWVALVNAFGVQSASNTYNVPKWIVSVLGGDTKQYTLGTALDAAMDTDHKITLNAFFINTDINYTL